MTAAVIPGFTLELDGDVARRAADDIAELLRSAQHLTMGRWGQRFEEAFAAAAGTRYAVATSTGTAALEIALRAAGVEGREVVVPATTFGATPVAVLRAGGVPVLCDSAPGAVVPGKDEVEAAMSSRTAAVVAVHIGGLIDPAVDDIEQLCRERGVHLVEDAAHAAGSTSAGRGPGHRGIGAAYSFFNTKVLNCGEGGMLATDSATVAEAARYLRDHAKGPRGEMAVTAGSWRLPETSAILGLHQLARLPATIAGRRRVAEAYLQALARLGSGSGSGLEVAVPAEGTTSNWYKVIVPTPGMAADDVEKQMAARGVQLAGRVYAVPCHRQPAFTPYAAGPLPHAESHADGHVCLPIHSAMPLDDIERVVDALGEVLRDA